MGFSVRLEEYAPLGDFIMTSFVRDQAAIEIRFSKMDAVFLGAFQSKLEEIKDLESTIVLTEEQKQVTVQLYAEADVVNKELNFLNSYLRDAGLPTDAVSDLKKSLSRGNIEGALLEMKDVKMYVEGHLDALVEQGMLADFPSALEGHRTSMMLKNTLQNKFMSNRKTLVDANIKEYKKLYSYISKIAEKGKLVFAGSVTEEEYSITKLISRMRRPGRG
jgi:hypothetical protein